MIKLKSFFKMLFNNKEILKSKDFNIFVILLIFFINVSLVSVPNFYGKIDGVNSISNIVGIEEVLVELYDMELDCSVDNNSELTCNNFTDFVIADYNIIYSDVIDLTDIDSSTLYFSKEYITIIYVDQDDLAYLISGNYSKLNGFSFNEIKSSDYGELTKSEYYEDISDIFLTNIYFSNLEDDFALIYVSQFAQILIYTLILSGMFMLVNLGGSEINLRYNDSLKLVVVSMTGPALVSAILGIFIIAWASILFLLVYGLRLMLLYYLVNPKAIQKIKR